MDTQGNDGKGKTRVAVLGSGPAAMAAVWGLLQSAKAEQYEISIYQLGWRIGGKCATGPQRRPGESGRGARPAHLERHV